MSTRLIALGLLLLFAPASNAAKAAAEGCPVCHQGIEEFADGAMMADIKARFACR